MGILTCLHFINQWLQLIVYLLNEIENLMLLLQIPETKSHDLPLDR